MKPRLGDSTSTEDQADRGNTGFPLVSIIVPTRNSERYLSACLCSIREQDYPNVELLVVDRDSTDCTVEIALTYGATVLNAGPERSAQVNAGALAAQGIFLFRVDSDFVLAQTVVSEWS